MKDKFFTSTMVFLVSTLTLSATSEIDRKIETAAKGGINNIVVTSDTVEHYDELMVMKIRGLLLMGGNTEWEETGVSAKNGVITLTGGADSLAQKELIRIYVKELDWVKSVQNLIVVADRLPLDGRTIKEEIDDASINTQLNYTILHKKATCTLNPSIVTRKGVITITGNVGSEAEKALVSKFANEVRGVKTVKNNMLITP